ncbi:MAG TPA: PilZ domain-containing protein [Candidatus Limnocylindrales bacterium]
MSDFSNEPEIKDRVALETKLGPQTHLYNGTIANLTNDEVWIALGRSADFLSVGVPVRLILHRPDEQSLAADTTMRRLIGGTGRIVGLWRPEAWVTYSRRANSRVALAIPAYLHPDHEGTAIPARTTNISVGGFHCITNLPISVGNQIEVSLLLTPTDSFDCRAQVVRLTEDPDDPNHRQLVVAFRFVDLDATGEARIAEALAALNEETDPTVVPIAWRSGGAPGPLAG